MKYIDHVGLRRNLVEYGYIFFPIPRGTKRPKGKGKNKVMVVASNLCSAVRNKVQKRLNYLNAEYNKNNVTVFFGNRSSSNFNLTLNFPFDIENPNFDAIKPSDHYENYLYDCSHHFRMMLFDFARSGRRSDDMRERYENKRKWEKEHKEVVVANKKQRVVVNPDFNINLTEEEMYKLGKSNQRMFLVNLFKTMYSWARRDKTTGTYRNFEQPVITLPLTTDYKSKMCCFCLLNKQNYDIQHDLNFPCIIHSYGDFKHALKNPIIFFGSNESLNGIDKTTIKPSSGLDYDYIMYGEYCCFIRTVYQQSNEKIKLLKLLDNQKQFAKIQLNGFLMNPCKQYIYHFVKMMMPYTAMNLIKDEQINFHMLSFLSDYNLCGCKSCEKLEIKKH